MTLAPFPDPELAVCDLLADLVQAAYPGSRTLTTINSGKLPALRAVRQAAGASDRVTDTSVISIAVFAGDAATAKSVAEQVRQRLTRGPFLSDVSFRTDHGRIDRAAVEQVPQLVTSPDVTAVQCSAGSYRVSMRR